MIKSSKIIAVDFDGTLVKDAYPGIGKPLLFAFETLKQLDKDGYRLILWTYRSGDKLKEAVDFCQKQGVEFYAINESYPNEEWDEQKSRKIHADIFVDDRMVGGMKDWSTIYQEITGKSRRHKKKRRKGLFW